jgi:acyl-CoA synthetase (AMP-forming)/AMP-acid ligase II/acyl carrier protein
LTTRSGNYLKFQIPTYKRWANFKPRFVYRGDVSQKLDNPGDNKEAGMKGRKPNFYTFVETLNWWAAHQPDQIAYTYLVDGEREEIHLTYVALDRRARAIGARLQSLGAAGERVILLFPSGLDYIAAFFGCLYARAIAIPVYPPHRRRPDPRLSAIVKDAQATIVLTTSSIQAEMQPQLGQMPELAGAYWIASDAIADEEAEQWKMPALTGETIAYLQYTSGSTAAPKGVMVSHGNLIYNNQMLKRAFEHVNPVLVSWLPIYHDMGLVGNILQPLYLGSRAIFMAPTAFLQSPYRWLQAISRYQANTSGGPNFSYELCVEKITPEQRETLDLSSWSIAYNAAEPVRHATLERFSSTFAPYGFRCEAFYPGYGLAEATLFVSGGCKNAPPITQSFEKAALARDQVIATSAANKTVLSLVDCGHTWLDQQIAIVDPKSTTRCPPGQVGEIWIAGPNVAQGYWNQPDATATTFQAYLADTGEGPFLRTGDLGFLHGEDLFVTGRIKDLIIIHGKNYYPQDIELTVEQSHPSLRPGCCAALSLDIGGEERLVIVAEIEREYLRGLESNEVFGAVRRAVAHEHQVAVYAIQLLKPAQILKTSSGKLQRHLYRERFLAHGFELVGSWQSATTAGEETPQAVGSALFNGSLHNPFDVPLATANGQPDHSLIPAFRAKRPVARADSTPQSLTEKRLVALWADVFKVDHVGRHDNFFDLGGHSLRATALIHQVQTEFSVSFSVDQLYEAPTVAGMAQVIEQLSTPATTAPASVTPMLWTLPGSLIPLQTAGTQPPLFCVHPLAGVVFPYYEHWATINRSTVYKPLGWPPTNNRLPGLKLWPPSISKRCAWCSRLAPTCSVAGRLAATSPMRWRNSCTRPVRRLPC